MARRHYQVGRDVDSETEADGVGQRKLEEVDETGIGHLRALSPWLLMMMMLTPKHHPENLKLCKKFYLFICNIDGESYRDCNFSFF